jgi:hypothetical protein
MSVLSLALDGLNATLNAYGKDITIQQGAKGVNDTGDSVFTLTVSRTVKARVSDYDESEDRLVVGLSLSCSLVASCRTTDVSDITDTSMMLYRGYIDGQTYEIVRVSDAYIENTSIYKSLYLRRV